MQTLDIVIYGTGGAAKGYHWHLSHPEAVVYDRDNSPRKPNVIGYLDDDNSLHGQMVHGVPVLGGMDWVAEHPGMAIFVGIGTLPARQTVTNSLIKENMWFPSFISPDARIAMGCEIGEGVFVYSGCIVNVDAVLDDHCFLNMNVTIGHDSHIGRFSVAYPGASVCGNVVVGVGVALGSNCTVIQDINIGDHAVLGAMACVVNDIPAHATAVGIPARIVSAPEASKGPGV